MVPHKVVSRRRRQVGCPVITGLHESGSALLSPGASAPDPRCAGPLARPALDRDPEVIAMVRTGLSRRLARLGCCHLPCLC